MYIYIHMYIYTHKIKYDRVDFSYSGNTFDCARCAPRLSIHKSWFQLSPC